METHTNAPFCRNYQYCVIHFNQISLLSLCKLQRNWGKSTTKLMFYLHYSYLYVITSVMRKYDSYIIQFFSWAELTLICPRLRIFVVGKCPHIPLSDTHWLNPAHIFGLQRPLQWPSVSFYFFVFVFVNDFQHGIGLDTITNVFMCILLCVCERQRAPTTRCDANHSRLFCQKSSVLWCGHTAYSCLRLPLSTLYCTHTHTLHFSPASHCC